MQHDTPLITTIVAGLVLAYIFGMIANRLKMPPLVGYLFAGILAGPYTPGFVADQALGAELAELGVILLMFGVGLHFSLKDLMSVRALAIPGAIVQIGFATLLGLGLALLLGWDIGAGLLFGLALSVASTVVLLKALQDRRLIESERGRIAVGWLIVEDLAMVLALVLIPAIAGLNGADTGVHDPFVSFVERIMGGSVGIWGVLGLTIVKVAAFVGFMLVVGRRVIPWALHGTAHTGSRELFRLAVLAIALGVALGSAVLFGVSLALGAFFAGMILSESELSHRAAQETLPLRDAFAVLFFVSVGMLFDPSIIITNPLPVIATVFIIIIGKSLAAFAIVLLFRRPVATALTISASLAQIGEFSFILASMGVSLAILPPEGQDLILAGALISIVLNPVVFWVLDLLKPRFEARVAQRKAEKSEREGVRIEPTETSRAAEGPITTDAPSEGAVDRGAPGADDDTGEPSHQVGHTVLVGYGQVGRIVAAGIKADGGGLVVIEDSDHDVAAARAENLEVVFGNAASADVLRLANLPQARNLLVAISNGFEAGSVCESGRKLNPGISIIARAYSEEEETFLRGLGATTVIRGEREIGKGILAFLRGDGSVAVPVPEEPKLPVAENLLEKAAAVVPVAVVPAVDAAAPAEPPTAAQAAPEESAADVPAEGAATVAADTVIELPGPAVEAADAGEPVTPEPTLEVAIDDPVVLDAVEAADTESVIALPGPDEEPPAAELESVAATPTVGEAPAAIDEVVAQPAETQSAAEPEAAAAPPPEETAAPAGAEEAAPALPDPEADVEAQTEAEAEAETNEGGIAPPEGEDEGIDRTVVPPVVPEPKS
ncbi:cation:proton antiporter [Devosia oryziradicis]|uniref:Cation:proton antiporter n=1 Tax=Devosia oryziradicis TaxID=2801335 RepID=A0ABX7C294_9HYPH|nr:cation:proton antiporter [Devosia oryziradicis]